MLNLNHINKITARAYHNNLKIFYYINNNYYNYNNNNSYSSQIFKIILINK